MRSLRISDPAVPPLKAANGARVGQKNPLSGARIASAALSWGVLSGLLLSLCVLAPANAAEPTDRWSDAMAAFARQDAESPHPQRGIVFVGSSSIRLWDLKKSFPKLEPTPLNRGFGGSEISDSIRHAERLVLRHQPRLIVMYAGDNDIAGGKSPEQVHGDFEKFSRLVLERLPKSRLAYMAIKPSVARWAMAKKMDQANQAIRHTCEENSRLTFVDIWKPTLGDDGRPRADLLRDDGLHLNEQGYAVWTQVLRDAIPGTNGERLTADE